MNTGVAVAVNGQVDEELTEAGRIEVYERMGRLTEFRLVYTADIIDGEIPSLVDSRLDAGVQIDIDVSLDNRTHRLVRGRVTGQSIRLRHGGAGSSVEVEGYDSGILMDRVDKSVVWKDVTDSDAVRSILSEYGLTADVETTAAGHFEAKHTLVQRSTDLQFLRKLARRNGFLFWITCDDLGLETAHFKKPPLEDTSPLSLAINLDSPALESFEARWDIEKPTSVVGRQLDLSTKNVIDGAASDHPLADLGDASLAAVAPDERSIHVVPPVDDSGDLTGRSAGVLTETSWFVSASCATTPQRAGGIIRAHGMVAIAGAGRRHSGRYFVSGVRHTITADSHTMALELLRNAWST